MCAKNIDFMENNIENLFGREKNGNRMKKKVANCDEFIRYLSVAITHFVS